MISVDQLKVVFGGFELFKGVSFLITPKDRIGLTGKNGAGKSTLLKILSGLQKPSEGVVSLPKDARIGYLPQQMVLSDSKTVFEETKKAFDEITSMHREIEHINHQLGSREDYESPEYMKLINRVTELNDHYQLLGGGNIEAEIEQTLTGLGFKRSDFTRQTSEFSGGWRMRIELAKILLKKPDVFLLDEPTNHLDIESIQWLEDFLKVYSGSVVLVSHDRAFLDNVTNRTIEISLGRIYDYKANYSRYLELRKENKETQLAAYQNQQKMIEDAEAFIARFRYQATKAVQVQSRVKMLEKLERIEIEQEDNSRLKIKFQPTIRSGTIVSETKAVTKRYGDLLVLDKVDLNIERGEKVAFVGKNGEGKTTLARIILNELEHQGEQKLGHNVKVGYFAQNQAQLLDENLTVFDTIDHIAVGDIRTKIRDILGAFMFSGEDIDKKVSVLSGGERSRLAMIRLMLEPVNFLVMDEPTNHLDMRSKEMLKQALAEYDGTVLIVSHDREFLDGLVNCVYEFKDNKIKQHLGGIYDFLQRKKIESMKELERKGKVANNKQKLEKPKETNNLSFEERKAVNKGITRCEKAIEKAEMKIAEKEELIEEMDKTLASSVEITDTSLYDKYDKLKASLERKMEEWESLHTELEELIQKENLVKMNDKPQKNDDIIFGMRPIIEAINSGKEIEKVLIKNGLEGDLFKEFYELVKQNNIPFQYVPVERLDRATRNNHQGVVAYISPITFQDIEKLMETWLEDEEKMPVILVLDQITDIRNFGAIVRTAECAGVDAVVIPAQGAARINADAVKTSAGALHHMPICKVKNTVDACMMLQQSGIDIIAATEKSDELYTDVDFTNPVAIVMGSEDRGIDRRIINLANNRVKVPILGKIESLNVSVAAGLLVYEVVRQRSL